MKRALLGLAATLILCGCGKPQPPSDVDHGTVNGATHEDSGGDGTNTTGG